MKFNYIRLVNFKQFYGEHIADISSSADKNVTVFHGENGAGKTSLFYSINWCLYGIGEELMGDMLNRQLLSEMQEDDVQPVIVTVKFRHNNIDYIAERIKYYSKIGNEPVFKETFFTMAQIDAVGQHKRIENPQGKMDTILPEKVREYFFFDGEKMDDLTKPGNTKIEEAIRNIMRLPILDSAERHLVEIYKEYRAAVKREGSPQTEAYIKEQEALEKAIEDSKKEIKVKENEVHLAEKHVQDIENTLEDSRLVGELQRERREITGRLQTLEIQKEEVTSVIVDKINGLYGYLLDEAVNKALQVINTQVGKGKIPSGIKEQFLQDILTSGRCICGKAFEKESESYHILATLLQQTRPNKFEDYILSLRGELANISRLVHERKEVLTDKCNAYYQIDDTHDKFIRQRDELTRKIGNCNEVDITALEESRASKKRSINLLYKDIGRLEDVIQKSVERISVLAKLREEEEKKQKNLRKLRMREKLANEAALAMGEIKANFYEETRKRVEAETKRVFDILAWKTDQFNEVRLDPEFHLEVIDRWNRPTRQELSAGERQILSLAFVSAMAILSGEESPVMMDTPFARLSGDHLKNISENLPLIVPQLILFVTANEWNESSKTGLITRIGKEFTLNFDDHSGCTELEEV